MGILRGVLRRQRPRALAPQGSRTGHCLLLQGPLPVLLGALGPKQPHMKQATGHRGVRFHGAKEQRRVPVAGGGREGGEAPLAP